MSDFTKLIPYCSRLAAASLLLLAAGARANASNMVTDFLTSKNPNGVWSYYYQNTAGTYVPFNPAESGFINGMPTWWTGSGVPNSEAISINTSGATRSWLTSILVPNNTVWLGPEAGGVALLFTAPTTGTYRIDGAFSGIDENENSHPVNILDSGSAIFSGTIATYGQIDNFNLTEHLSAGDSIWFQAGTGSAGCSYCYLSTGLTGTVSMVSPTAVPEPSARWFLLLGLAALFVRHTFLFTKGSRRQTRRALRSSV